MVAFIFSFLFFFQISRRVYEVLRSNQSTLKSPLCDNIPSNNVDSSGNEEAAGLPFIANVEQSKKMPFELYKSLTTIVVTRETFLNVVCDALSGYKYVGPNQRADLMLACR